MPLRPGDGDTAVTLGAKLRRAGPRDRLVLALGGRAWMRGRFDATLRALGDHLRAAGARGAVSAP